MSAIPQTVLVTGGTGFIALEIIHQLLVEGKYKVRATVRSLSNIERNQPLLNLVPDSKQGPPELVAADLLSPDGWDKAVDGVDYVLHTASPFFISQDEDKLVKPALEGTLNVLKACATPGSKVKRVVITSSIAAVISGHEGLPDDHVFTEADWTRTETPGVSAYNKSKTLAEKAAWEFVRVNAGHQFSLNTINPTLVIGQCRTAPGTSVDLISQLMTGKMPMVPKMPFGVVDVRDVAAAHIAAMVCKEEGERFICSRKVMDLQQMAEVLAQEFRPRGVNVTTSPMPFWLARVLSLFMAPMKMIVSSWGRELRIDASKAERVLGIKYTSAAEALTATGNSLIQAGTVVPKKK